ncbi:MAG: Ig-like domain-containing protein [Actinomycetota bacterium]|nr:Ig-like domain-containing protein [Actinomycetota bacterium]
MAVKTLTTRSARAGWAAAAAAAAVLLVGGCQSNAQADSAGAGGSSSSSTSSSPSSTSNGAVSLSILPSNGAAAVAPNTTVRVTATGGPIATVTVKDTKNRVVNGRLSSDGLTWTASRYLRPSMTYSVNAASQSGVKSKSTFSTFAANITATYHLLPSSGSVVGVGMPLTVQFDSPVADSAKADVERNLSVTTSPAVTGSWGWLDDRQVMFRSASYWKTGTKISLKANLAGVKTGTGKYVGSDASTSYQVGSAMMSYVNMKTHQMKVYKNGKLLRILPVSTGRPGPKTETRYGIKVIVSKETTHIMDSTSIGIPKGSPGYYRLTTQWAMRLTWSGEFLHSAPWSVGAQGNTNVSHGCTNLSPSNANWLFGISKVGDVVKYTGSSRAIEQANGYTLWNYSWTDWKKRSARA